MAITPRTFDSLALSGSSAGLSEDKKRQLDIASSRMTPTDRANIEYAQKKYGYVPPQGATPMTPAATSVPTAQAPSLSFSSFGETSSDPLVKFSSAVAQMLKDAQKAGDNTDLYRRQAALRRTMIDKGQAMTPEELRYLSPREQSLLKQAEQQSVEPELDAVSSEIKARNERLANFERVAKTINEIGEGLVKVTPSKAVIDSYKDLVLSGEPFSVIPADYRDAVVESISEKEMSIIKSYNAKKSSSTSTSDVNASGIIQPKPSELNSMLVGYDTEFKLFVKDIAGSVGYKLTPSSIGALHQQWLNSKKERFGGETEEPSITKQWKESLKAAGIPSGLDNKQSTSTGGSTITTTSSINDSVRQKAGQVQKIIEADDDPLQAYREVMAKPNVPSEVKKLLVKPKP